MTSSPTQPFSSWMHAWVFFTPSVSTRITSTSRTFYLKEIDDSGKTARKMRWRMCLNWRNPVERDFQGLMCKRRIEIPDLDSWFSFMLETQLSRQCLTSILEPYYCVNPEEEEWGWNHTLSYFVGSFHLWRWQEWMGVQNTIKNKSLIKFKGSQIRWWNVINDLGWKSSRKSLAFDNKSVTFTVGWFCLFKKWWSSWTERCFVCINNNDVFSIESNAGKE